MIILVDYNNILIKDREKGLNDLLDRIINLIDFDLLKTSRRVYVRLYSGWYKGATLTKPAQQLATTILADFPKPIIVKEESDIHALTINAELAYSLAIDPAKHFWHTYRPRSFPPGIVCDSPSSAGCTRQNCPLLVVSDFIQSGKCPIPDCNITPEEILHKAEQKLVDAMITTDLIYYACTNEKNLSVVTSDDDLWPGITSSLINGATITHIHTRRKRNTPMFYTYGTGKKYIVKKL